LVTPSLYPLLLVIFLAKIVIMFLIHLILSFCFSQGNADVSIAIAWRVTPDHSNGQSYSMFPIWDQSGQNRRCSKASRHSEILSWSYQ
jgi:hypothetical protein